MKFEIEVLANDLSFQLENTEQTDILKDYPIKNNTNEIEDIKDEIKNVDDDSSNNIKDLDINNQSKFEEASLKTQDISKEEEVIDSSYKSNTVLNEHQIYNPVTNNYTIPGITNLCGVVSILQIENYFKKSNH